jgi:sugar phosphate isomerase/epimerase
MSYYSVKVKSPREVLVLEYVLSIGEGIDVFTRIINDLDEFRGVLKSHGVEILEINQLDKFEAVPVEAIEVPGLPTTDEFPLLPSQD